MPALLFAPHLGRLIARFDARRRRAKGVFGGMAKLDLGGELSRGQNFRLYRAAAKHDGTPVELMQVVKPSRKVPLIPLRSHCMELVVDMSSENSLVGVRVRPPYPICAPSRPPSLPRSTSKQSNKSGTCTTPTW